MLPRCFPPSLAILNLYNTPMPSIKFLLNLTYGLWGDVVWRISWWPLWWPSWPSWILEQNNFSNSESLCRDASHQVLAQSNWFGRRCHLKNFKMANDFSNSESLCHCDASHQVSAQSDTLFGRKCKLMNFKMAAMAAIFDILILNRTTLAILNLHVATMPSTKFQLNPTYGSGGDVKNMES